MIPIVSNLVAGLCMLLWMLPTVAVVSLIYYLLSLPLRRQERARFFLDVLETSLNSGQAPEQAIVAMSASRDPSLGARFHWLAALLEMGRPLGEALGEVPRFLPPRVASMLRVGLVLGDVRRVLPACRHQLGDGVSQVQGAMNYVVVLAVALSPAFPVVMMLLAVFVFPKLAQMLQDMGSTMPSMLVWFLGHLRLLTWSMTGVLVLLYGAAVVYVGGPHLAAWFRVGGVRVADYVAWGLPWKRARLRRDFVALLSLLLDQGVAEAEALRLVGRGVENAKLEGRVRLALEDMQAGRGLRAALERLDDSREFAWRLNNVEPGRGGFMGALAGWLESLDARAFRAEQVAAQMLTTAIVLMNGTVVGVLVVSTFQILIRIVNEGVTW